MARNNFKSRNPQLEPYVDDDLCIKRGADIDSYCVFKSTYGGDFSDVDEDYNIYTPCLSSHECNSDSDQVNFNKWIIQFFP